MSLVDLLADVRDTVAAALGDDLTVHEVLPDSPKLPMAYLGRPSSSRDETLGAMQVELPVMIVADGKYETALRRLNEWTDLAVAALKASGAQASFSPQVVQLEDDDPASGFVAPRFPAVMVTVTAYS